MNITPSVDERVAANARETQNFEAFEQRCLNSGGRLNGWKFNREEANARGAHGNTASDVKPS